MYNIHYLRGPPSCFLYVSCSGFFHFFSFPTHYGWRNNILSSTTDRSGIWLSKTIKRRLLRYLWIFKEMPVVWEGGGCLPVNCDFCVIWLIAECPADVLADIFRVLRGIRLVLSLWLQRGSTQSSAKCEWAKSDVHRVEIIFGFSRTCSITGGL